MPWYTRVRNVFRGERVSRELERELAFHLAESTDRLITEGLSPREAQREARLRLGNYSIQKERTRDMDVTGWLEAALADLSFGIRQLRLNPGFTAVAVLSLALGIGANTSIFQLINTLRLRGLPVKDPVQLAAIDTAPQFVTAGWYAARNRAFTYAQLKSMRRNQQAFTDMLAFGTTRFDLSTGGQSHFAEGLFVSDNFLRVLGVLPFAGRDIDGEEDKASCTSPSVLLNYAFWQNHFGGDLGVIGKTMTLNSRRFTIAGITPPRFFGVEPGRRFDVAVPLCADGYLAKDGVNRTSNLTAWWLTPIGRLKPGWTIERASGHFAALSPTIFREALPNDYRAELAKAYLKNKLRVVSASAGVSSLRRRYESPLWILMSITGLVLLIACANLANLLLARASAREREIAVRQAIGASRLRLVVQLLSESLLLALTGGILGALLAQILSHALVAFLNTSDDRVALPAGVDWQVFGFTAVLAVVTCLLFGLVPALRASSTSPVSAMRGGRTSTATRERQSLRRILVISQVALSLVLLVAALLFSRSLQKLLGTGLGFDSRNVLLVGVTASGPGFQNDSQRRALFQELDKRIPETAGVVSASSVGMTPFSGNSWNGTAHADDDKGTARGKEAWFNRVGPGYFSTMGTPLLAGRDFNSRDDRKSPDVALVNQVLSKRLFNGRSPVGRTFRVEAGANKPDHVYEIVGVVADTKYQEFREESLALAYFPTAQDEDPGDQRSFVIRGRGQLDVLTRSLQREISNLNPNLLVESRVLDVQIRESVLRERLMANLSLAFGVLAACLSTLGLYGVMSYMVARRRSELGLRVALGAGRHHVLGIVFKDAGILLAIGVAAGLVCSLFLSRYAESLLFGLKGNDPVTLVWAVGLLAATAVGATLIPAWQAARLEPVEALREE